ncbi:MAG: glycosyltransferase family 9 protein [Desulfobacterota bacterium]|nr:glycosyltransferase family 9 protein [Thermodesulfobacteriota bacterium]
MKRILVIQLARIGDIVQSMPMLQSLKRHMMPCRISMLVNKKFADICRLMPCLDEILEIDFNAIGRYFFGKNASLEHAYSYIKHFYGDIQKNDFSEVINITPHYIGIFSAFLTKTAPEPKRRLPWELFFKTITRQWNVLPYHLSDLFKNIAGMPPSPEQVQLKINENDFAWADNFLHSHNMAGRDSFLVGLHPGASTPDKQWPLDSFMQLGKYLLSDKTIRIIVVGDDIRSDANFSLGVRCISAVGKTSLSQLAALLKRMDVFITNDTGPMHIAAACGTRTISIHMGKETCFTTGPYTTRGFAVQPFLDCHPCQYPERCMRQICKSYITPELLYALIRLIRDNQRSGEHELTHFSDRAVVYRGGFDPYGFFDWYPVTRKKINVDALVRPLMRILWKCAFDNMTGTTIPCVVFDDALHSLAETLGQFYEPDPDIFNQLSTLNYALHEIITLSRQGINLCKDILRYAPNAMRNYQHLKQRASETEAVDRRLVAWRERMPLMALLIDMFFAERQESKGNDITQVAYDARYAYETLYFRARMLQQMCSRYPELKQTTGTQKHSMVVGI